MTMGVPGESRRKIVKDEFVRGVYEDLKQVSTLRDFGSEITIDNRNINLTGFG